MYAVEHHLPERAKILAITTRGSMRGHALYFDIKKESIMTAPETMQTCAMCAGQFPGPGIQNQGKVYCCDKCADYHQHKLHMLVAMAPKLAAVLGVGAIIGYLVGRRRN